MSEDAAAEPTTLECHDCGETYAPGMDASACIDANHYLAPLAICASPVAGSGNAQRTP